MARAQRHEPSAGFDFKGKKVKTMVDLCRLEVLLMVGRYDTSKEGRGTTIIRTKACLPYERETGGERERWRERERAASDPPSPKCK